jgi:glycosyltransferase involved in cell wall biosynthesis
VSSPALSVCIPAYQNPGTLRRAIESLARQDFPDFEVLITDDSPDDAIAQVVKSIKIDAPVTYRRNSERLGAPQNWNYCVSLARADLVKILHHDDWLSSTDSLAEYVRLMECNPQANLGFSATIVVRPNGSVQRINRPSQRSVDGLVKDPRRLFPKNIVGSPSATIMRAAPGGGFDPQLKWLVDMDFYIRVLLKQPALAYTRRPLVCTTNGLASQVTAQSLGNKRVELFEWTYLYARLFVGTGVSPTPLQLKYMWDLLGRHHVDSFDDFTKTVTDVPIPRTVAGLILARQRLARIGSVLRSR